METKDVLSNLGCGELMSPNKGVDWHSMTAGNRAAMAFEMSPMKDLIEKIIQNTGSAECGWI